MILKLYVNCSKAREPWPKISQFVAASSSVSYLPIWAFDESNFIWSRVIQLESLSASGASSINIYDTTKPDFPVVQTLDKAHPLGIHHLVTAREEKARRAASAGFEGKVKIWSQNEDGIWTEDGEIVGGYAFAFIAIAR